MRVRISRDGRRSGIDSKGFEIVMVQVVLAIPSTC